MKYTFVGGPHDGGVLEVNPSKLLDEGKTYLFPVVRGGLESVWCETGKEYPLVPAPGGGCNRRALFPLLTALKATV